MAARRLANNRLISVSIIFLHLRTSLVRASGYWLLANRAYIQLDKRSQSYQQPMREGKVPQYGPNFQLDAMHQTCIGKHYRIHSFLLGPSGIHSQNLEQRK